MTVLVGILCSDGVVLASDSAATLAAGQMPTIGQQSIKKVHNLAGAIIYAATGAVGMAQVISDKLERGWVAKEFRHDSPEELMHKVGVAISQIAMPYLQSAFALQQAGGAGAGSVCKSLAAVVCKREACLFSFEPNGAPEMATKEIPFIAAGSGQAIADPFLAFLQRLLWTDHQPTVAEGKLVAVWTIGHVCKTNPGGVGGAVQMMVLTPGEGIQELDSAATDEHTQRAAEAEQALVRHLQNPLHLAEVPAIPVPPAPT